MTQQALNQTTSQQDFKAAAKLVGKNLKQMGHAVPHSVLLHAMSAAFGHTGWHALKNKLEGGAAATTSAVPTVRQPWCPTDADTLFWARLARFMGAVVYREGNLLARWTYRAGEEQGQMFDSARSAARMAVNALTKAPGSSVSLRGVFDFQSWGWVAPADLDLDTGFTEGTELFEAVGQKAHFQVNGQGAAALYLELECIDLGGKCAWRMSDAGRRKLHADLEEKASQPFAFELDRFELVEVLNGGDLDTLTELRSEKVHSWRNVWMASDLWEAIDTAKTHQLKTANPVWVVDRLGGAGTVVFKANQQPGHAPANSGAPVGPAVTARFFSDDHVFDFEFDASAWMAQAGDQALTAVFNCGFGGDYPTDDIGLWMEAQRDEEFVEAFVYINAIQKRKTLGFEVKVDGEDYCNWLQLHRPALLAKCLCERYEVSIVQAEEPELQGMYDWLSDETDDQGNRIVCDRSFESFEAAALDASQTLDLLKQFGEDGCFAGV